MHPRWWTLELRAANPQAVTVGPGTYFTGTGSRIATYTPLETIEIGAYCSIADDVRLVNPHDPTEAVLMEDGDLRPPVLRNGHRPWTATTLPVGNRFHHMEGFDDPAALVGAGARMVIGSDVWIGYRATILGGVTIGHGAIIGAGSVVMKDVAPYTIVAGNRAAVVRSRFEPATVQALLQIAWWNWTEDEVMRNAHWFLRPVEEFVARFAPALARD